MSPLLIYFNLSSPPPFSLIAFPPSSPNLKLYPPPPYVSSEKTTATKTKMTPTNTTMMIWICKDNWRKIRRNPIRILILIRSLISIQTRLLPPPTPTFFVANPAGRGLQHLRHPPYFPRGNFNPAPSSSPSCWNCSLHHSSNPNWIWMKSWRRNFPFLSLHSRNCLLPSPS